jgi:hypothetical protein
LHYSKLGEVEKREKIFARAGEIPAFLIDTRSAFLAKRFPKEISK